MGVSGSRVDGGGSIVRCKDEGMSGCVHGWMNGPVGSWMDEQINVEWDLQTLLGGQVGGWMEGGRDVM